MPRPRRLLKSLAVAAFLNISIAAPGAVIVVSGAIEGSQVRDWRTPGTIKTKDPDGDNIYGTMGALNWQAGYTGMQSPGSATFGWAAIAYGAQSSDPSHQSIDSPPNAPNDEAAGIAYEGFTFQLTGTNADYAGKTIRVGVMSDVLGVAAWSYDNAKGYHLFQTVGGTGDSPQRSVRGGSGGDGSAEMYFWDLSGIRAGDQFRILALQHLGNISLNNGYVGAVTWDVVPEPSIALIAMGAAAGLLLRRQR